MGSRRRSGDRILESRHLIGLFLGVVLLCAVFFSLGYVMGRSHYSTSVQAAPAEIPARPTAELPAKVKEKPAPAPRPTGEWDFYTQKDNNRLEPPAPAPALAPVSRPTDVNSSPAPSPVRNAPAVVPAAAKTSGRSGTPKMLQGAIVLQVAAVTRSSDALAMAEALQQKKFSAFVVAPASDNFYRVQVGPYSNDKAAEAAKTALDREGFKAIIRR